MSNSGSPSGGFTRYSTCKWFGHKVLQKNTKNNCSTQKVSLTVFQDYLSRLGLFLVYIPFCIPAQIECKSPPSPHFWPCPFTVTIIKSACGRSRQKREFWQSTKTPPDLPPSFVEEQSPSRVPRSSSDPRLRETKNQVHECLTSCRGRFFIHCPSWQWSRQRGGGDG